MCVKQEFMCPARLLLDAVFMDFMLHLQVEKLRH